MILAAFLIFGAAHASWREALVGFPTDEVQLNAVCQGLLAQVHGAAPSAAIARLREHRMRTLGHQTVEPRVTRSFVANEGSGRRTLARLAGHLRGIERWDEDVFGYVLSGADQIERHLARLNELREAVRAEARDEVEALHALSLSRGLINGTTLIMSLILGRSELGLSDLAYLAPYLVALEPVSANRALLIRDHVSRAFEDDLRSPGGWIFASRTYRLRRGLTDALRGTDLRVTARAMREQDAFDLNRLASVTAHLINHVLRGRAHTTAARARSRRAYLIVDQLRRFDADGIPELIVTVRLTTRTPRAVNQPAKAPPAAAFAGQAGELL